MPRILTLAILLAAVSSAIAATYTWDGTGSNNDWTTTQNWLGDPSPITLTSADLIFAGTTRLNVNVNSSRNINGITFDPTAGAFTFSGSSIGLGAGGITNNSSNLQLIKNNLVLNANQTWSGTGDVTAEGKISGSGSLTKDGSGTLTLAGGHNTYTGDTILKAGTLRLGYQQNAISNIPNNRHIEMVGGILDSNNSFERIGTLTLSGNSSVLLTGNNNTLLFNDSSSQTWNTGATLTINDWSGTSTGISDKVFFGTSASGLNAGQLAQIKFFNPAGFAAGTYGASILGSGEVVPVPEPATMGLGALLMGLIAAKRRKAKLAAAKA